MAESHRCMFFFSENIHIRVVDFQVSYAANLHVSDKPSKKYRADRQWKGVRWLFQIEGCSSFPRA